MNNLYDIQCPECGSDCDLHMFDASDLTLRPSVRLIESQDGMSATVMLEAGEWIGLGPYLEPEMIERAKALSVRHADTALLGIPVWCPACGYEGPFESFEGDIPLETRRRKALVDVIRLFLHESES
jgi:predicted RNA-binding Zn-ribbon protein involved in translation (DUF1610 family)